MRNYYKGQTRHQSSHQQTPSFCLGMMQAFDIGAVMYTPYIHDSDARALLSDWQAVGGDIWRAMCQFDDENQSGLVLSLDHAYHAVSGN